MRRPVTMADVAAQAGVAESTVSHVVNGTRPVSAVLRARVLQAISETGYSPNTVARSLATSYTHLIGIVMSALTNRFFVPVVAAIDSAGRRHGYSSVLADSRDRVDDEADAVNMLLSRRVDGIVLTPTAGDREAVLDKLAAGEVPTVLVDRFADDRFDQVGPENTEATAYLVQHLATLGHDRIAFLSGRKGLSTTSERATGYRLGLERAGLAFEQGLVCSGNSAAATAERSVSALLARRNPPTAIVSGDREMTIGVLRALQRSGMHVPDDIALVAYDDLDFADVLQPALTVMAQPVSEIASTAVNLLIRRITGKAKTRDPQRVQIATTFIHRESCGCALKG
jgi:LacI family transcriptional regulator, galactose operon repressor